MRKINKNVKIQLYTEEYSIQYVQLYIYINIMNSKHTFI